jgi:hypothetical protein
MLRPGEVEISAIRLMSWLDDSSCGLYAASFNGMNTSQYVGFGFAEMVYFILSSYVTFSWVC